MSEMKLNARSPLPLLGMSEGTSLHRQWRKQGEGGEDTEGKNGRTGKNRGTGKNEIDR